MAHCLSNGEPVAEHLPEKDDWLAPTIVQIEFAKWLIREIGEDRADQAIAFTQICNVIDFDTEIALAAAEACRGHGLATAGCDHLCNGAKQRSGASNL